MRGLLLILPLLLLDPGEAEAGCQTCTASIAGSCDPGYVCQYDEGWEAECCVADSTCTTGGCSRTPDCAEYGTEYVCIDNCCVATGCEFACRLNGECRDTLGGASYCSDGCCYFAESCSTNVCDFGDECASGICRQGCCEGGGPSCETATCEAIGDCSEFGDYVCDTRAGCCVPTGTDCREPCDAIGTCAAGFECDTAQACCVALACPASCESDAGCEELGTGWTCDQEAGCCVEASGCASTCDRIGGCSELGTGWECDVAAACCVETESCMTTCETISGCQQLGTGWVCDTAASCCVRTSNPGGGNSPPIRVQGGRDRSGCGCRSAGDAPSDGLFWLVALGLLFCGRSRRWMAAAE